MLEIMNQIYLFQNLNYKMRCIDEIEIIVIHRTSFEDVHTVYQIGKAFENNSIAYGAVGNRFPYHFVITPNEIQQALPLQYISYHARGFNSRSLAIAIIGDFRTAEPEEHQRELAVRLVDRLVGDLGIKIENIQGHDKLENASQWKDHECPGKYWSMDKFRAEVDGFDGENLMIGLTF